MMKPGGRARITCPPDLAYGDRGAALQFDVEPIEAVP